MSIDYSLNHFYPKNAWIPTKLINGDPYYLLDAKVLIKDFYSNKIPLMEWDKKTIYYCGVEGSGKTNAMRFSTWVLNQNPKYVDAGLITILTNDIRILGDKRYKYLFEDVVFINLLCDDAMGAVGTDSVDYMDAAGRSVSKEFVTSRHIGEDEIAQVGIVFMSFATQSWNRLNKVIRDNSTLKIFTSYIDTDWFRSIFPPKETQLLRESHHNAHVSSNWLDRCYVVCRTGAAGIVTLKLPYIPKSQYELNWCKNAGYWKGGKFVKYMKPDDYVEEIIEKVVINSKEDFLKQKTHKNKIYVIDRSIDHKAIINRMSRYLITHKSINYLIKYHPKRNSLEDFSRGKLYGFLREEGERIVEEFCVDITKSDMLTAIEDALKEQDLELVRKMKNKEITFNDDKKKYIKTFNDRILACFEIRDEKIMHVSDFVDLTHLSRQQIDSTISKYSHDYINPFPGLGYYSTAENPPTEEELGDFVAHTPSLQKHLQKSHTKKLKMEDT
jgi:hypothetical protein